MDWKQKIRVDLSDLKLTDRQREFLEDYCMTIVQLENRACREVFIKAYMQQRVFQDTIAALGARLIPHERRHD